MRSRRDPRSGSLVGGLLVLGVGLGLGLASVLASVCGALLGCSVSGLRSCEAPVKFLRQSPLF